MKEYQEEVNSNREREQAMLRKLLRLSPKKNHEHTRRCQVQHKGEWTGSKKEKGECRTCHENSSAHWRCTKCQGLVCRSYHYGAPPQVSGEAQDAVTPEQNSSIDAPVEAAIVTNESNPQREAVIVDLQADYESDEEDRSSVIASWDKEVLDSIITALGEHGGKDPEFGALLRKVANNVATLDEVSYLQDCMIELRKSIKPASQLATPPTTPPQKQRRARKNITKGASKKRASAVLDLSGSSGDDEPPVKRCRPLQSSKTLQQHLISLPVETFSPVRKQFAAMQLSPIYTQDEPIVPNARIKKMVTPTRPHFHIGAARLQKDASSP